MSRSWRSVQDQSGRSTLWRALWTSVKGLSKLPNLRDLSSVSLRTQAALAAGKTQEDINTWKASNHRFTVRGTQHAFAMSFSADDVKDVVAAPPDASDIQDLAQANAEIERLRAMIAFLDAPPSVVAAVVPAGVRPRPTGAKVRQT